MTTRNAWAFAVDPDQWIPIPRRDRLDDERKQVWIEMATEALVEVTLVEEAEVPTLRARCAALLDRADDQENCAFLPIAEPFPELVRIHTLDGDAAAELGRYWRREGAFSEDESPIDAPGLTGASRIMRVDDDGSGGYVFGVAFMGVAGDLTAALTMETKHALVAGQFGGAGADVFSTFERR